MEGYYFITVLFTVTDRRIAHLLVSFVFFSLMLKFYVTWRGRVDCQPVTFEELEQAHDWSRDTAQRSHAPAHAHRPTGKFQSRIVADAVSYSMSTEMWVETSKFDVYG